MVFLISCSHAPALGDGALNLPWPPPSGTPRQAAGASFTLAGSEYASCGGDVQIVDGQLTLRGSAELSYVIYTIGGFSADNECRSLTLEASGDFGGGGSTNELYAGLAYYRAGCWHWSRLAKPLAALSFTPPEDYRSSAGEVSIALVVTGSNLVQIDKLIFSIDLNMQPAPQNLSAAATDVELLTLSWDSALGAEGYSVYRSYSHTFSNPLQLNPAPLPATTFLDELVLREQMLYYRVTAVGTQESPPSNTVDIWSPGIDMPAPQNAHVAAKTSSSFTIA